MTSRSGSAAPSLVVEHASKRYGDIIALDDVSIDVPDGRSRADDALRLAGLESAAIGDRWPHELSGGQRQRVAMARALAGGQSLLLLDEPFGALDAITRSDLQRTLRGIREQRPLTILLVTHDLREATLLADAIAVLRGGRVEQVASPSMLLR